MDKLFEAFTQSLTYESELKREKWITEKPVLPGKNVDSTFESTGH